MGQTPVHESLVFIAMRRCILYAPFLTIQLGY